MKDKRNVKELLKEWIDLQESININAMDAHNNKERFIKQLERMANISGCVIAVEFFEPAKGGGWSVVFNNELAARRVFMDYTVMGNEGRKFRFYDRRTKWVISFK